MVLIEKLAAQNEEMVNVQLIQNLERLMAIANMTEAELARRTNIPQPTLHKILTGKTADPRASTLKVLADYFNISIDNLLGDLNLTEPNETQQSATKIQSVPVISWSECINAIQFIKGLTPTNWDNWAVSSYISKNAYGLASKPSMEPRFPKGSILFIDPELIPEDGDMVVVLYPNTQETTLRELSIDGPLKLLLPISPNVSQTVLSPDIKIFGVLVKSTFSYHS